MRNHFTNSWFLLLYPLLLSRWKTPFNVFGVWPVWHVAPPEVSTRVPKVINHESSIKANLEPYFRRYLTQDQKVYCASQEKERSRPIQAVSIGFLPPPPNSELARGLGTSPGQVPAPLPGHRPSPRGVPSPAGRATERPQWPKQRVRSVSGHILKSSYLTNQTKKKV